MLKKKEKSISGRYVNPRGLKIRYLRWQNLRSSGGPKVEKSILQVEKWTFPFLAENGQKFFHPKNRSNSARKALFAILSIRFWSSFLRLLAHICAERQLLKKVHFFPKMNFSFTKNFKNFSPRGRLYLPFWASGFEVHVLNSKTLCSDFSADPSSLRNRQKFKKRMFKKGGGWKIFCRSTPVILDIHQLWDLNLSGSGKNKKNTLL